MPIVDAMPGRPLRQSDADSLEEHPKIETVHPFVMLDVGNGDQMYQVVVSFEDLHVALAFDDEPEPHWTEVHRSSDFSEVSEALSAGADFLNEASGSPHV